ncbi:MAG: 3-phosphoshikimate 1-carboxyvinyltransferase [Microthrixaceae bacterium]
MTESLRVERLPPGFDVTVPIPGSKSITNRALLCAGLASGTSTLRGALDAEDTAAMIGALRTLGARIDVAGDTVVVAGLDGALPDHPVTLDANRSGTTGRFLMALSILARSEITIVAAPQLAARPMEDGLDAVAQLGVGRMPAPGPDPLPVTLVPAAGGGEGHRSVVTVGGDVSSQFLTALLLAAPCRDEGLRIRVRGALRSEPYVELTMATMAAFGATVRREGMEFTVEAGGYRAVEYRIEPDASAASYFFAAAAACGGRVAVEGIGADSIQGDARFADVLAERGAIVRRGVDTTVVEGSGRLVGGVVDMADISDTAPTLAAIAPLAATATEIEGIGFTRAKESNRVAAMVAELGRLGIVATEERDGLRVEPGEPVAGTVRTYDDHRIAMSFAVLGAATGAVTVDDPGCVVKTFPRFWETFAMLYPSDPFDSIGPVVAIDGPAGSGKSTISKLVAQRLGMEVLDTGAMYRAVTCAVLRAGGDPHDPEFAAQAARHAEISFDGPRVEIDGDDVTEEIRGEEVSGAVSIVATHGGVRDRLRSLQRDWLAAHGGGVAEGRDIGTVVAPDAMLKIFLVASPEVRARRRAGEGTMDMATAVKNLAERDRIDSTRDHSPLRPAPDAITVDTTAMTIEEVVDVVCREAARRLAAGGRPDRSAADEGTTEGATFR